MTSIKARIAAVTLVLVAIALALAGVFVVDSQRTSLTADIDDILQTRADDIVALLEQGVEPDGLGINKSETSLAVVIGAAAGTALVARQALRPVDAIRNGADKISLDELNRRIPEPARLDEIGKLVATFNHMISRLDEGNSAQQRLIADIAHELRSPVTAIATQHEVDLTHPDNADWGTTAQDVLDETRRL